MARRLALSRLLGTKLRLDSRPGPRRGAAEGGSGHADSDRRPQDFLASGLPRDRDVDFKVHAPYRTVIEGQVRHGQLIQLKVIPSPRQKDIEIMR